MAERLPDDRVARVSQALETLARPLQASVLTETYRDGTYLYIRINVDHYAASRHDMLRLFDAASKVLEEVMPTAANEETWSLSVFLRREPIGDAHG